MVAVLPAHPNPQRAARALQETRTAVRNLASVAAVVALAVTARLSKLILHFELSMICCAFFMADSSGVLSFFRMSIAFCAEAAASFLFPSFA